MVTGCDSAPGRVSVSRSSFELNISAASSLTNAIKEINGIYSQERPDVKIFANFASSGTLQKQIENGAPCDIFVSAADDQMDPLEKQGLILDLTLKELLHNQLVLIVPATSELNINQFFGLAEKQIDKIAIGDPKSVPAGTYARLYLEEIGIYSSLASKLVLGSDVRQVLAYVESGNVSAGLVYISDTLITDRVKIITVAPDSFNELIQYPVAVVKSSQHVAQARDYENYLFSPAARDVFEKYGFTLVGY